MLQIPRLVARPLTTAGGAVAMSTFAPNKHAVTVTTPLYESHIPTTRLQKLWLAASATTRGVLDPTQTGVFGVLAETTGRNALCAMHAQMLADPVGQRILRERPRVRSSHIDMDCLRLFPEDSFGFAYARFMDENGFDLDDHRTTEYVDDVELACVMQRQRELHDVQHVMFGVPPTVFGEVTLKHLEYAHTGLPSAMIISQLGWFKLSPDEKRLAATEFVPWARRAGRNARAFVTVASEDEFAPLLEELREKLNIEVAPRLSAAK